MTNVARTKTATLRTVSKEFVWLLSRLCAVLQSDAMLASSVVATSSAKIYSPLELCVTLLHSGSVELRELACSTLHLYLYATAIFLFKMDNK